MRRHHARLIAKVLRLPEVENGYLASGNIAVTLPPEAFGAFVRAEIVKWGQVVRDAKIQGE